MAECFGVFDAALEAAKGGDFFHDLKDVDIIVFEEPLQLTGVLAEHGYFLGEGFGDVDVFGRLKLQAHDGVHEEDGGNLVVGVVAGLEERGGGVEAGVLDELAGGGMVGHVVVERVSDNDIGASLSDEVDDFFAGG